MTDEQRGKLKGGCPKVKQVKLRIMLSKEIKEFVKHGGTYETYLWKMFHHATHVKLLGSKFGVQLCYNYSENNDGIIVTEMDYSEHYQLIPLQEIQSEKIAKDANVSMEIRIATFQRKDTGRWVVSYSHLSDKKTQIAATTFQNTIQMMNDLIEREDLNNDDYAMVIFITDGCAGQLS